MADALTYLQWRGDLSWEAAPFTVVDALILTELTYFNFDTVVPESFSEGISLEQACKMNVLHPLPLYCTERDIALCRLIVDCPRFQNIRLCGFTNTVDREKGTQFCALTFCIDKKTTVVAFRGTDDSIVGWKENMELAYEQTVPAQQSAVSYLEAAARVTKGQLIVSGHSKGGNLAVYAAAFAHAKIQKRISTVYNFDGPGFNAQVIAQSAFAEIVGKVKTYVPQDSIIGLLLEHKEAYTVIHSMASNGLSQHDVMTWEVTKDDLVREEKLTKTGENYRENISEWIASMTDEEKKAFIEVVFRLLEEHKTIDGLFSVKNLWSILREYRALPEDNKKAVAGAIGELKDTIVDNIKEKLLLKLKNRLTK